MKVLGKFLTSVLAIGLLAGCNKSENLTEIEDDGNPLYMSVKLKLPTALPGTRTATGETDEEPGKDYENAVRSVLLVLADKDDKYIAHSTSGKVSGANSDYTVTSSISKTDLGTYYNAHGDGNTLDESAMQIHVYAFCNPPRDLLDSLAVETKRDRWMDISCEVGENNPAKTNDKEEGTLDGKNQSIWAGNSFLMSNTQKFSVLLPQKYSAWEEHATLSTAYKLTPTGEQDDLEAIPVERSVARFDFKDGSGNNNTYDIEETTGNANGTLKIQLVRMSLVNMSKSFYYLKRVTTDYTKPDPELCGTETPTNWVMDTDWDKPHKNVGADNSGQIDASELKKYYNFRLFNDDGGIDESTRTLWNNHLISKVLGGKEVDDKNAYHIWRYVTENTIPGETHQRNGASTGIVFKGWIKSEGASVNKDLSDALNGNYQIQTEDGTPEGTPKGYVQTLTYNGETKQYPILYLFENILYVGWNHQVMEDASKEENQGSLLYGACYTPIEVQLGDETVYESPNTLYQRVVTLFKDKKEGTPEFTNALKAFRQAATTAGFTLYQASVDEGDANDPGFGPGYYCYYYYWNRHNDNGRPGTMGAMEFGVVRNNVYKLSVDKINYLGHPRRSDNDPEPPKPEDPDEKAKVYLQVSVHVRPWTVRENSIEF